MAELERRDHVICAVAAVFQILTLRWTWDLWAERSSPPNLPLVDGLASVSWGWLLVVLCVATAIRPRWGGPAFGVVLALACLGDQTRLQPGVISVAVLMIAPAFAEGGRAIARWHLCSVWLWAGIHKLMSPGWSEGGARFIADSLGRPGWREFIAFVLPLCEIGVGLTALWPRTWRLTAAGAVLLHVGIFLTLSPRYADWNSSVWPWNLAVAATAPLLFLGAKAESPFPSRQVTAGAVALLAYPALFYVGAMDAYLAHNLYTSNTAAAVICQPQSTACTSARLDTWRTLNVPLPPEPRLFRQAFDIVCEPGEELLIVGRHTRLSDPPSRTRYRCV